ncbi:hypothetical protein HK098_000162 [Nowakowskiella sp. JEL0407]|nr:hypothetical protein HK098_000162 [Nowakowskiella sp. JEL0407]
MRNAMINLHEGFGTREDLSKTGKMLLKDTVYTSRVGCTQQYNLTGKAPQGKIVLNSIAYSYISGNYWNIWCDYKNQSFCQSGVYDYGGLKTFATKFDKSALIDDLTLPLEYVGTPDDVVHQFEYTKLNNCGESGSWLIESSNGNGRFTYASCAPKLNHTITPYACSSTIIIDNVLPTILKIITPTQDSRLIFIDASGQILATNLDERLYPHILVNKFLNATQFSDQVVKEIGIKLSPHGDWYELQNISIDASVLNVTDSAKLYTDFVLNSGESWMVVVSKVQFETPDVFYLIIAIPRNDLFRMVEKSINQGAILSSIFAAVGIFFGIIITIGVLFPLRKLKFNIERVTDFDFSVVSSGGLDEDSIFTEVKSVQTTFNLMVKAFAGAIKRSKERMSRGPNSAASHNLSRTRYNSGT